MEPATPLKNLSSYETLLPGYSFGKCEVIGTGAGSVVVRVKSLEDNNEEFACKIQNLRPTTSKDVRSSDGSDFQAPDVGDLPQTPRAQAEWECRTLADMRHAGSIVELKDWAIDDNVCLMVIEYAKGGTLDGLVRKRGGKLDEADARTVMLRLLKGVMNMHKNDISHRDLKLDNLILMEKEDVSTVKISDLGMSKQLASSHDPPANSTHSVCGTPFYMAPEMLSCAKENSATGRTESAYGVKIDVWSCGIILYMLLSGEPPFKAKSIGQLFHRIMEGRYDFESQAWDHVSQEGKDFVRHLLTVDAKLRPSSAEALLHPWLSQGAKCSGSGRSASFDLPKASQAPTEGVGYLLGNNKKSRSINNMDAMPWA